MCHLSNCCCPSQVRPFIHPLCQVTYKHTQLYSQYIQTSLKPEHWCGCITLQLHNLTTSWQWGYCGNEFFNVRQTIVNEIEPVVVELELVDVKQQLHN